MNNGWINRGANAIARSGARLGPLDAVFAGLDYVDGKAQGEDDIRALAGAGGSTLGGWGGAAAGMTAGTPLGPLGMAAGAIIGGTVGGFAGGWGADRVDETIRGNKGYKDNMASFNQGMTDEYGRPIGQQQQEGFDLFDLGALGAGGYGAYQAGRNIIPQMGGINPVGNYQFYRQQNVPRVQAARNAVGDAASLALRGVAQGWRNTPRSGKAGLIAAGVYGANEMLGKPIQGIADAITGNAFDFDGKGRPGVGKTNSMAASNTANRQRDQQQVNEAYNISNYEMPLTPEQVAKMNAEQENNVFWRNNNYARDVSREGDERFRRRLAMELRAEQATELGRNFSTNIPNSVANQVQAIFMGGMVK